MPSAAVPSGGVRRLILASAESYVKLADAADTRSLEGAFLEQAIQRLRTISGTQARVEELHRRLLVAEKQALAELKGYERPLDLKDSIERARAHVTGQPLPAVRRHRGSSQTLDMIGEPGYSVVAARRVMRGNPLHMITWGDVLSDGSNTEETTHP